MAINWDMWSNLPGRIQQTRGNEFDFSSISPAVVEAYSNYQAMRPKRRLDLLRKYEEANKNIKEDDVNKLWLDRKQKEAYDADLMRRRQRNLKNIQSAPEPYEGNEGLGVLPNPYGEKELGVIDFGKKEEGTDKVSAFGKLFDKTVSDIKNPGATYTDTEIPYAIKEPEAPEFGLDMYKKGLGFDTTSYENTEDLSDRWDDMSPEQKRIYFEGTPTKEEAESVRLEMLKNALGKEYEDARSAFDEYGGLNEYQRMRKAGEQASIWNPQIGKILTDAANDIREDRVQGWKEAVEMETKMYEKAMDLYEKSGKKPSYRRMAEAHLAKLGSLMDNSPRKPDSKDWWYEGEQEGGQNTLERDAKRPDVIIEDKIESGEISRIEDFAKPENAELWSQIDAVDQKNLTKYLSDLNRERQKASDQETMDTTAFIQTNVDPGFINEQSNSSLEISELGAIDKILNPKEGDPKPTTGDYQMAMSYLQKMGNNVKGQFDDKKKIRWNNIQGDIRKAWNNDDYGSLFGSIAEGIGFLFGEAFGLNEKELKEITKNPQHMRVVRQAIRSQLGQAQRSYNFRAENARKVLGDRRVPENYAYLKPYEVAGELPVTTEDIISFNLDNSGKPKVSNELAEAAAMAIQSGENKFVFGDKNYKLGGQYGFDVLPDIRPEIVAANPNEPTEVIDAAEIAKEAKKTEFKVGNDTYTINSNNIIKKKQGGGGGGGDKNKDVANQGTTTTTKRGRR